jgi:hypothetical protein
MPDSLNTSNVDTLSAHPLSSSEAILNPGPLYVHPIHGFWEVTGWIFLITLICCFVWLFLKSAMCRDESFDSNSQLRPLKERPFSYSRVQLCWWSLIILVCYWYFFMRYGVLLPLTSTIAFLLGGPIAVFVFGRTIDNTQIKTNNEEVPTRHQDTEKSQGFFIDILSDDTGISIHRLQAALFNVIYGIGFISYFLNSIQTQKYPFIQFETWQFALLGISAAGYLAIKANENPDATKPQRKEEALAVRNLAQ